ncbi:hypothetical protein ACPCVO_49830 [Streptomyces umbrinus]|uniref:hypothetical protein n=1 Tax=Streptomyces umbrinus TaxID=67370 RepID=UPI003C2EE963
MGDDVLVEDGDVAAGGLDVAVAERGRADADAVRSGEQLLHLRVGDCLRLTGRDLRPQPCPPVRPGGLDRRHVRQSPAAGSAVRHRIDDRSPVEVQVEGVEAVHH